MTTEKQKDGTYVVTGVGRASYLNAFTPRLNDLSGKEEYSMSFLIPKSDTDTIHKLKRAANTAAQGKWGDVKSRPAGIRSPFRDGDEERPEDPAYQGHIWINIKSNQKPTVVDARMNPVIDPREFVSGDYCRVSVNAAAYAHKANKGVSFWLNNIQVVRKGEPLSGGARRAESDFEVMETSTAEESGDGLW
jgi:Protein of unknown function (DUF2815)